MAILEYDAQGLEVTPLQDGTTFSHANKQARWNTLLESAKQSIFRAHETGELGFLTCFQDGLDEMEAFSTKLTSSQTLTHQLVLGIGGSSLGALAILATTGGDAGGLKTVFSENIDPVSFHRQLQSLPLETTLVVVISKSGTTIETMSKFWIVYNMLVENFGEEQAAKQVVAITDPEKGSLRKLALEKGFHTFGVPPEVGGRFSVLTPVGLLPLLLAGYDIRALVQGAQSVVTHIKESRIEDDLCAQAAADQIELLQQGNISQVVMMPYCDDVLPLADWFRQLWAESLGKRVNRKQEDVFTGITPLKALGVIDQHSQVQLYAEGPMDKHVMFVEVEHFEQDYTIPMMEGFPEALKHLQGKSLTQLLHAELEGTRAALISAARPTSLWRFASLAPQSVGAFILAWEMITALAGELLDINAYDQPGVELGKKIAHGLLGHEAHLELAQQMSTDAADSDTHVWSVK